MSDGGDANASNARTEDEHGTSNAIPKTTPVLWADMSDGDDEDDEYVSAHRGGGEGRPGTGGVNRTSGMKSTGARLESRALSNNGGSRGGSGQRPMGGQRSYGRGPILERRGSRTYALSGTPSSLVVQHGQGMPTQQRRQPPGGLQTRSGNSSTFSRNQSSTLSHASSPIARRGARPIIDIPPVDPGAPYRLYVTPLPMNVTHSQIRDAFTPIKLKHIELGSSTRNDKTQYAFIELFSYDDMVLALTDLQNQLIGEHRISLKVQRRKDPSTFKVARSVGQLSDKPSDRDSERGITPPRTEGTLKGHKKALLCMLASDNDNTTRDTKIFGTGKPREEKWEEPPPVVEPTPPPDGEPAKSPDAHKQTDPDHATPPSEQRPPPPPPAEVSSYGAKSPPRQPADSGSDSMNSSNVQRNLPMPDAEDRHPIPRQQFRDIPHLMSMPPMAEVPRHPDPPAFSPPPPTEMMMNYGMMPKPYLAPAPTMMDLATNQGYRYPPDGHQYPAVMTPQMFWAPPDEFSQPPMGPRIAPPPDRPHHLPGTWADSSCVPYIGHTMIPQPAPPVIMGGYDLMHMGGPSTTAGLRPQGLQMAPMEPVQNASMPNSTYFESNGVRPPEEVVTMPVTYGAARGPSPRQGPEPMIAPASNPTGLTYACRPTVMMPNPRGPSPATNPSLKRASPPPPMPPAQSRFTEAPVPPPSHPASSTSCAEKVPSPPSSLPTVSPSQQQQQSSAPVKARAEPPPPAPNSRPSYASVVGADKKPKLSSSGVAGLSGEAIPYVSPSVESSGITRVSGNARGGKGRGARNQTRRNQQQQTGGRVWMKQPSSHEAETATVATESTRNKIGHSDSCSTDDFLEFAKGRKRS